MQSRDALDKRWLDSFCGDYEASLIALRRHLHAHPEVGWHEQQTSAHLYAWLSERGLTPQAIAGTGLFVDVGRGDTGVLYRADIDALPIQEVGRPHGACVSQRDGISHACGHDVHSTIAAGIALGCHLLGDMLPGRVRILFQPAEEVLPSGAAAVIDQGVFEGMEAALGLHCDPARDCGTVGLRLGEFTATSDKFEVIVHGRSGHSARPHLSRDAIAASADIVSALYGLVGHRVDPLEPAVVTVGRIEGGTAENVIAGQAMLSGTIRTLNTTVRQQLHTALEDTVQGLARLHGCKAEVTLQLGPPPVVNDARLHEVALAGATEVLGSDKVALIARPSTGAEDFGYFCLNGPAYMLRLGVRKPGSEIHHLHTPAFDPDERAIAVGIRVMLATLLRALAERR